MNTFYERERRFIVSDHSVVDGHSASLIVQAYLFDEDGYVVRIRRTHYPDGAHSTREGPAVLAAKGPRRAGAREEYELEVPPDFASALIRRARRKISKSRYQLVSKDHLWDVDVFHGSNEGLVIAECEAQHLGALHIPSWCSQEITGNAHYDNENLANVPYELWGGNEDSDLT